MSSSDNYSDNSSENNDFSGIVLQSKQNFYGIFKKLGSGAYADVWLGVNLRTQIFYALKITHENDVDSVMKEIKAYDMLKKLKCPNLCEIYESFECKSNGNKYFVVVLELLTCSLYDLMKYRFSKGFDPITVLKITKQICDTLNVLHSHDIIYSDLKPENIMICNSSQLNKQIVDKYKLVDFKKLYDERFKNIFSWKQLDYGKINKLFNTIHTLLSNSNTKTKNSDDSESKSNTSETSKHCDGKINVTDSENSENSNESNSNMSEISHKSEFDDIDVTNIKIKIVDFGTVLFDKAKSFNVQTRYYRSPEIVLKKSCSSKIDMWSLGAIIYELLCNKRLFHPKKTPIDNRNRHHLKLFADRIGPIPNDLIVPEYKLIYFKSNGELKNSINTQYDSLNKSVEKLQLGKLHDLFLNLITGCLLYDANARYSAEFVANALSQLNL